MNASSMDVVFWSARETTKEFPSYHDLALRDLMIISAPEYERAGIGGAISHRVTREPPSAQDHRASWKDAALVRPQIFLIKLFIHIAEILHHRDALPPGNALLGSDMLYTAGETDVTVFVPSADKVFEV